MADMFTGISNTATSAVNVGMIVIIGIICIGVVVFVIWMIHNYKKWSQFEVRVWSVDAFGQVVERKDTAGIFVDKKTMSKRFFVKKCKADLPPDKVPVIYIGKKKVVYIRQIGIKNFEYVMPSKVYEDRPPETNALNVVSEQDVNWAVNDYERQKQAFARNQWLQYLPFIALGVVAIVIMVIFIYFFKKLDVLEAFGQSLVEASRILNPSVIQ